MERLCALVARSRALLVLTGAGVSTESGIPDYRDDDGAWKRRPPVTYLEFVRSERVRQRYWARSLVGWEVIAKAEPNAAHHALARLEAEGKVHHLITQNVDGLHQRAGSRRVTDLHGRLDAIACLACGRTTPRDAYQEELRRANPSWPTVQAARTAPDGDADLEADTASFLVPPCARCGGVLKPSVVFFGESVPRARVEHCYARLAEADALLVAGSSLMVFSGYRFVRAAAKRALPVAVVGLGRTRADQKEATLKVVGRCGDVLPQVPGTIRHPFPS